MASSQKPDVTPEEIQHAHDLWHGFTGFMKWGIIAVIASLILMALFLL
jgi:hypothetical protein